ncbi:lipocalin family protein [Pseudoxanthomonas daejeonensis]|uniref:lipocalin family protein n=1 Tax=Pseudoxanthomonas daejeonensis TaxID=266062 RepID=UPI001F545E9B|nr:lipocalin family protein [Pseudoxanthomonas daejeonensis]UNK56946.1 lipocalin family protein [Pseudoxanthomonas daejeonensis]
MRALPTLLLTCIALSSSILPASAASPVASVPELELTRYAGHWYEIAHLPVSFQRRCAGDITAAYALRADGTINVRNTCRTRDGDQAIAEGVARTVEGHPGRLQVRFVPGWLSWLPLVWADYWVIALDPDYQWAVVGDPDREYLWILSREPSMDAELFSRLKTKAETMGYDLAPLVVAAPLR